MCRTGNLLGCEISAGICATTIGSQLGSPVTMLKYVWHDLLCSKARSVSGSKIESIIYPVSVTVKPLCKQSATAALVKAFV